jgi:two-component system KDP operon response regulator KdpE
MRSEGKARILIVDYEREMVRALRRELVARGYEIFAVPTGEKALVFLDRHRPDLLLLDLNLPGISGLEVCARIRAQSNLPPIIVTSSKDTEARRVQALDLGADDHVAKPFDVPELLARIRVALRHAASVPIGSEPRITIGPLQVDFAQRGVLVNGQEVKLTPTEYDLLKVLITHRGQILTSQMLLTQVWGTKYETRVHSLHVYIGQLRRKIEKDPGHPQLLQTLHGVGYRFDGEGGHSRHASE